MTAEQGVVEVSVVAIVSLCVAGVEDAIVVAVAALTAAGVASGLADAPAAVGIVLGELLRDIGSAYDAAAAVVAPVVPADVLVVL